MFYLTTCLHRSLVNIARKDFSTPSNPRAFPEMLGVSSPCNILGRLPTGFHEPCHDSFFFFFFPRVEPELFCWNMMYITIVGVGEQVVLPPSWHWPVYIFEDYCFWIWNVLADRLILIIEWKWLWKLYIFSGFKGCGVT